MSRQGADVFTARELAGGDRGRARGWCLLCRGWGRACADPNAPPREVCRESPSARRAPQAHRQRRCASPLRTGARVGQGHRRTHDPTLGVPSAYRRAPAVDFLKLYISFAFTRLSRCYGAFRASADWLACSGSSRPGGGADSPRTGVMGSPVRGRKGSPVLGGTLCLDPRSHSSSSPALLWVLLWHGVVIRGRFPRMRWYIPNYRLSAGRSKQS